MVEKKTIKIDQEVYDELRKRIQEFDDTPNAVLRRVFNIDFPKRMKAESGIQKHGKSSSKNIIGRIEGDRQRDRLKKMYGSRIDGYPILYHAGWPRSGVEIQKYSFGIPARKFQDQMKQGGFVVFICGKAEESFFIPCQWISDQLDLQQEIPKQLKFNIPVSEGDYFWMKKKDGISINCFKNKLP